MTISLYDKAMHGYLVAHRPSFAADAPFDLCFTPEAMKVLLASVGARRPETGAKAFGPIDRFGFDIVEFDAEGSHRAGNAIYSPDTLWGEQRCRHWLDQPDDKMRLWTGDVHSHPGGFGHPSGKSGPGKGDLGYVEKVFAQNEAMQYFAIPIVTLSLPGRPVWIWPWIVSRDKPDCPLWADVRICPASDFPERVFNPSWEASLTVTSPLSGVNNVEDAVADATPKNGDHDNVSAFSPCAVASSLMKQDEFPDSTVDGIAGWLLFVIVILKFLLGQDEFPSTQVTSDGPPQHYSPAAAPVLETDVLSALSMASNPCHNFLTDNRPTLQEDQTMNSYDVVANLNPNILCGEENGRDIFIEDVEVQGRWFRLEYRCLPSSASASAWLLSNPWGANTFPYEQSHLRSDGMICIGAHYDPDDSPYDLDYAIRRARFWAVGYSYLREHGYEATCDAIPDW